MHVIVHCGTQTAEKLYNNRLSYPSDKRHHSAVDYWQWKIALHNTVSVDVVIHFCCRNVTVLL